VKLFVSLLLLLLTMPALAQDRTGQEAATAQDTAVAGDTADQQSEVTNDKACTSIGSSAENCLRVGVRRSARPFAYYSRTVEKAAEDDSVASLSAKSGPLRAEGYDGYMVYICDEVLKQLMIPGTDTPDALLANQVMPVDIDELMKDRPGQDRFSLLGKEIDILCDPATISLERVRNYAVSPPLFLTGIGYLTRRGSVPPSPTCPPKDQALIGVVGTTNAAQYGIQAIIDADEWKKYRPLIVAALKGDTENTDACKTPEDPKEVGGIIWAGRTHDEVAQQFCNENIDYYVGDLEIILEHARKQPGCDPVASAQSFTNDRYAIFARIDYGNVWKAPLIGRFFEVLNREIVTSDSLLDRAYIAEFGAAKQSRKLELFFWSLRGAP
jgi:hypothetical protein